MNKETRNNILISIGVILTVILGIYLFQTQHLLPKGVTQIRWSVDNSPMRKVVIDAFEKKNPNIHVLNDPNADVQTVLTQIAGKVPPDIITPYTIESFRRLQRLGQLEDLTPYVKKYNMPVDKIRPSLHDFVYIKDKDGVEKVYGIPENGGPFLLFYNKDVFDEEGIPYPANDITWEEVRQLAIKLTKYKTLNGRKIAIRKGLQADMGPDFWAGMYGGKIYSEDGTKCVLDDPKALKGLQLWEQMRLKDDCLLTGNDTSAMAPQGGWAGGNLILIQGKVAMMLGGRYLITQLRDYYSKGFRLGMCRFPRTPYPCNTLASKCYCIPTGSKHKEEAAKFLAMILSDENQTNIVNYGDSWTSVDTPKLREISKFNPDYPMEDNNVELLKDMEDAKVGELNPLIDETDFATIYQMETDKVWLGEQNMEQAIHKVVKDVNKIINRNINNPNFLK